MQGGDERVDLRCHHDQDPGGTWSPVGKGMDGTGRDIRQFPGGQDSPLLALQHLECAVQHIEGLVGAVV